MANLAPEKLAKIRRFMEVEEQLEFRCGMPRQRVVAVSPANGPGRKDAPEEPERKPGKPATSEQSSIATHAKLPPKVPPAEPKEEKKVVTAPAKTLAEAAKAQAPAAKKPDRREAGAYVSPQEVNPFSLSRYGTTR